MFFKKKGLHFDFIPKIKVFSKKKGLHFDSLILDFLFCSQNQTLPMLMQRKHVLPKLTQCAAKRKYCAGVPSLLRGRAGAQLRGNIAQIPLSNGTISNNIDKFKIYSFF